MGGKDLEVALHAAAHGPEAVSANGGGGGAPEGGEEDERNAGYCCRRHLVV